MSYWRQETKVAVWSYSTAIPPQNAALEVDLRENTPSIQHSRFVWRSSDFITIGNYVLPTYRGAARRHVAHWLSRWIAVFNELALRDSAVERVGNLWYLIYPAVNAHLTAYWHRSGFSQSDCCGAHVYLSLNFICSRAWTWAWLVHHLTSVRGGS